jgi:iron complex outermembrane recepter protein
MRFKTLAQSLALSTCLVSPAFVAPAFAQTAAETIPATQEAPKRPVETVIVTGSSIKRQVNDSSLPLQIITRTELEREGISSTEQLIMQLSSNGNGLDNLASNADVVSGQARGNNGASSANLRGQGAAATLVLLNGRRVAAHGLNGGAVDINQIPLAAVERVDVLKDGASAIYGTDAIGGVINFITRKDFEGFNVTAFTDITEEGGSEIFRGSILGGFGNLDEQGFNIMATLAYSDNKALNGSDRDFVNTFQPDRGLSVDTRGTPYATILPLAGTILPSAGTSPFLPGSTSVRASGGINVLDLPGGAGCNSIDGQDAYDADLWDFPEAEFACAWDTGRAAVLQQPITNLNFISRGVLRLGEHEISAEVTASKSDSAKRFSNLQLSPNTTTQAFRYPRNAITAANYDSVFNALVRTFPTLESQRGQPIGYRWRCIPCGVREIETTSETRRFFIGADGPMGAGWEYRTGFSYASSETESQLGTGYYYRNTTRDASGNIIANGIIDALNTGIINPFLPAGQSQTPEAMALLQGASAEGVVLYGGKFELNQFDGSASGPMFDLPGGKVYGAVGFDLRTETYSFNGDQRAAAARPVIIAAPFDDANALTGVERRIEAIYGELLLPLIEGLELTLAVRRDAYSGFGSTTNPKVSVKYRPFEPLMFRGSYNTGFRVPSFNQIFNGLTRSPYAGRDLADPATCPGGRPDSTKPGCAAIEPNTVETVNGGRRDLGPEKADQRTFGVVYEPSRNYSISVDWWTIERSDTITILSLQELAANYEEFRENYIRDAAGRIRFIDQRWVNAGESVTTGLELSMRGGGSVLAGNWTAGLDGTYLLEKKSRTSANVPFGESEIGVFTFSGDLGLEWKHSAFVTYRQGDWSVSLSQLFRSGYENQKLPGVESGLVNPPNDVDEVDDYITYNTSLTYKGFKNFSITAGIKNLLNTDPPFAVTYDSNTGAGSSWEPRVADPRGRSFTLLLDYKF